MKSDVDPMLADFVKRFLETNEAVVEATAEGFEALIPEPLSRRWAVPELLHLTFGPPAAPASQGPAAVAVSYGSALLDQMLTAACGAVPLTRCRVNFHYLKSAGFQRLIQEQFVLNGATAAVESQADIQTSYLLLTFAYLAQSDEQKQGLIHLGFNLETGVSVAGLEDCLPRLERVPDAAGGDLALEQTLVEKLCLRAEREIRPVMAAALESFEARMNRRFQRDAASLDEYYAALGQEMSAGLDRTGLSEQIRRERSDKIALLPAELARNRDDLFKKYSIRTTLRLCAGILVRTPAVKLLTRFQVGKAQKTHALIYNPITRVLDPMGCALCGASTYRPFFVRTPEVRCPECVRSATGQVVGKA